MELKNDDRWFLIQSFSDFWRPGVASNDIRLNSAFFRNTLKTNLVLNLSRWLLSSSSFVLSCLRSKQLGRKIPPWYLSHRKQKSVKIISMCAVDVEWVWARAWRLGLEGSGLKARAWRLGPKYWASYFKIQVCLWSSTMWAYFLRSRACAKDDSIS